MNPLEGKSLDRFFDRRKQSNALDDSPRYKAINNRIMDIQSRLHKVANQKTKVLLEELDAAMVDAESEAMYVFYRLGAQDYVAVLGARLMALGSLEPLDTEEVVAAARASVVEGGLS